MKIGAHYCKNKTEFIVWAPHGNQVSLVLPNENQILKMDKVENGYWHLDIAGIKPETRYLFRLDNLKDRPDPASHFQPEGVFSSSAVVDHSAFSWKDKDWHGIEIEDMIIYELHIGTFSPQGTFAAAKSRCRELSRMGINAVELMPVSQFSGIRNWGYDGVFPFAVQNTYGGPEELKKLVAEFHEHGIAVILDVVYNHLGPEGNFLGDFGPYFLFDQNSPWGPSINFDGPSNQPVRNFFLENAAYWNQNYHIDGLRLDAIYAIKDSSPKHFLKELSETTKKISVNKKMLLIAENDQVDQKIISPLNRAGYGLDAVWHDNFHHSLHALLTGERNWYYSSFLSLKELKDALHKEYESHNQTIHIEQMEIYSKQSFNPRKLVVFSQNHDQIGNRALGERLITLAGFEAAKLAAGIAILSQYTPLFFMGEEYAETAPFLFFTDFSNKTLGKQVFLGRKKELKENGWKSKPLDSQNPSAFACSKIDWLKRTMGSGKIMLEYYRKLLSLRKFYLNGDTNKLLRVKFYTSEVDQLLVIQKETPKSFMAIIANFNKQNSNYRFPCDGELYVKVLDSAETEWLGPGSVLPNKTNLDDEHTICPLSISVFLNQKEKK